MKPTKAQFFKRQITLSEMGSIGQEKLQNASVLLVGCGGLGGAIATYLASSGIGKLHLVDFDTVDVTNLHRQVFYSLADVGKPKAEVLTAFIKKRAPFTSVSFTNAPITKKTIFGQLEEVDVVIDATDSLPTKYLLNDACVLSNKPLVYGSLYKFDGYVATFNILEKDGSYTANLRDAFPTMATDIPNCEEVGTLNAIVGIIAMQQVNEVLKLITGVGNPLKNQLLIYNALENTQLKMKLKAAVSKSAIAQIFESESYFDANCEFRNLDWLITADEFRNQLNAITIISLIENSAIRFPFQIHHKLTLEGLMQNEFTPQEHKKYVFVCFKGNASYTATKLMKAQYPNQQFFSLVGGIDNF